MELMPADVSHSITDREPLTHSHMGRPEARYDTHASSTHLCLMTIWFVYYSSPSPLPPSHLVDLKGEDMSSTPSTPPEHGLKHHDVAEDRLASMGYA